MYTDRMQVMGENRTKLVVFDLADEGGLGAPSDAMGQLRYLLLIRRSIRLPAPFFVQRFGACFANQLHAAFD